MEPLSDATRTALAPVLGPTEHVTRVASAVGCTLVLTDRHLHLVRDGVNFRPRTGIRSWELDRTLSVRIAPAGRSPGRLIVERSGRSVSVFLTATHAPGIEHMLAEIRRRIYAEI
ncbi:MAG: hypothetical protein QOI92_618 [Chloroflexota bacterium]|jgi:hypothetical protein|nr:hypothetical protein [Chloroflexota bacterium]